MGIILSVRRRGSITALVTMNLTEKSEVEYKHCSTFVARDAAPEGWMPRANKACKGWPIDVTISSDRSKKIGWNVSAARSEELKRIQWVKDVDDNQSTDHLVVDCRWWWFGGT